MAGHSQSIPGAREMSGHSAQCGSWGDEWSLCTVWKDHEEYLSWERQHVSVVSTPQRQRQERPANQWANQLS